ncbi:MAG: protein kinase family protein [Acidimicrobiia bacterium]|nr:protein kinase family protein [Acidimicrobiia bacterium]
MTLRSELHGRELVAVKEGGSPAALRDEAALLAGLDHPGIVRFVALTDDERGLRLLTRYAGRETLATWQPQRLEELRRVIEEVAETVHHLHERGISHRSIRPAHVVLDSLRRPLLCGFSAARRDAADGAADDAAVHLADVGAIGETALAVLERLDSQQPRRGLRREQQLRGRLTAVAETARDGRVPSSRALASRLRAAAAEDRAPATAGGGQRRPSSATPSLRRRRAGSPQRLGRLAGRSEVRPQPPKRGLGRSGGLLLRRPRRASWLAAAAVGVGCLLGTLMILRLGDQSAAAPALGSSALGSSALGSSAPGSPEPGELPGPAPPARPQAAPQPGATPLEPADAPTEPAAAEVSSQTESPDDPPAGLSGDVAGCLAPGGGLRDVDGDGCAEQIRITPGFVSADGTRYPVGTPDDQVAVGDWDCDGVATVALVQPTGQVYLFEAWPREEPLVGTLVAQLPPPVELAEVARGACNELTVRYREGTWYLPLPPP